MLTAEEAREITKKRGKECKNEEFLEIFEYIKTAARNGKYSIIIDYKICKENIDRLKELNYKVKKHWLDNTTEILWRK